jgi:hypothetical protein
MKIIYKTGNMFDGDKKLICHSCNILGGFGSGVAGEIARRYPHVRKAYMTAFNLDQMHADAKLTLGALQFVKKTNDDDDASVICNMMCQPTYGTPGERHVSYDAVDVALKRLNTLFDWNDENKPKMMNFWHPDGKITYNSSSVLLKPIFDSFPEKYETDSLPEVAFPLFGSALGGGSWAVCAALLEYHSTRFQPIVYTLDGNIPK